MNALVLTRKKIPVSYLETPNPKPINGQVLVQLKAAGLNHRDQWILDGKYSGFEFPFILGSDGIGTVDGQTVLLNPSMCWDKHNIINGTFAELLAIATTQIHPIPSHLSVQQAAALPMEGLTAFHALFTQGRCHENDQVLISNIQEANGLQALQFAIASGANVYVTTNSDQTLEKAILLGAKGGANTNAKLWSKDLFSQTDGFDLILDGIGGPQFKELIRLTAPGCRIVTHGGSQGFLPKLNANLLARKQISLIGSSIGNTAEFSAMLTFVQKHQIVPIIDSVFSLCSGTQAFERLKSGESFGKIVLEI